MFGMIWSSPHGEMHLKRFLPYWSEGRVEYEFGHWPPALWYTGISLVYLDPVKP